MGAKQWTDKKEVLKYEYDFDVNGGAVGEIVLGTLPTDFLVQKMYLHILEDITSGGTPTITIGEDNSGDADGYFADFFGTPSAGTSLEGGGALISDEFHKVVEAQDGLAVNVGTDALTAGKFKVLVEGIQL